EQRPGGRPPNVKILDLGLAHVADADKRLTQQGAVMGTPAYMAPEQALGQAADPRSDLFSLGVVLYQMATGSLPFRAGKGFAALHALLTENPRPLEQVDPSLPRPFCELVL